MSEHRYPFGALLGDYARAGAGIMLTGAPLVLIPLNPYVTAILGVLVALFAIFGAATALRHLRRIELAGGTISMTGLFPVRLTWDAIESVRLRYFATRRDGARGWMELTLRGGGRRMLLDSRIDGFPDIARHAADAVSRRHIAVAPTTAANFAALGIPLAAGSGE